MQNAKTSIPIQEFIPACKIRIYIQEFHLNMQECKNVHLYSRIYSSMQWWLFIFKNFIQTCKNSHSYSRISFKHARIAIHIQEYKCNEKLLNLNEVFLNVHKKSLNLNEYLEYEWTGPSWISTRNFRWITLHYLDNSNSFYKY